MKDPMFKINPKASTSVEENKEPAPSEAGSFQVFYSAPEVSPENKAETSSEDMIEEAEIDFIIQIVQEALSSVDFDEAEPLADFNRIQKIEAAKRVLH